MKRIAIAGFQHETNTFSPVKTTYDDFAAQGSPFAGKLESADLYHLGQSRYNSAVSGFYHKANEIGFELIPLAEYGAEPSNLVPQAVFDRVMDDLLTRVQMTVMDGLFLDLHGAMVIEGFLDGETEILKRFRAVLGDIPIVASLDLHGNIAPQSMALCSAFVSCREYPHIDMFETGKRCAAMMDLFLNDIPVFYAFRQAPYLFTCSKESTFQDPSRALYAKIAEVEIWQGVHSASIMQGFAGADVEHMGPAVFAYASTPEMAEKAADFLLHAVLDLEGEFISDVPGVENGVMQAIRLAEVSDKPVVIADIQDNAGGGSSSDTMFILKELHRQGARSVAIGMIYDPQTAAAAHAAGEGAELEISLGGKFIPGDSPLTAKFRVEYLHNGQVTATGPMAKGLRLDIGRMALLRLDDILIVVGSTRIQAADQSLFTVMGVDPARMNIVVVKSANHFRADFEPIASQVISIIAPGTDVEDPATFMYRNLRSGVRLHGNGPVHTRGADQ